MEPKIPEMYFPLNLHKLEPLPKYSVMFFHHELECRSFESKRPATPTQSRLQKSEHSLPQQSENLRKVNTNIALFTRRIMPQTHELL
jgi:hypothetical protein